MFKVNNTTYFTPFSSVSVLDFVQLNVSWVDVVNKRKSSVQLNKTI